MAATMDKELSPEERAKIEKRFTPFKAPSVQKKALEGFAAIERGEYVSYPIPEIKRLLTRFMQRRDVEQ
ncbi:MAG: hypothetical protein F4Y44_10640 [Chloroflexi bacterium]|nr:hypothetical protein [Chloroflexota bacterium]